MQFCLNCNTISKQTWLWITYTRTSAVVAKINRSLIVPVKGSRLVPEPALGMHHVFCIVSWDMTDRSANHKSIFLFWATSLCSEKSWLFFSGQRLVMLLQFYVKVTVNNSQNHVHTSNFTSIHLAVLFLYSPHILTYWTFMGERLIRKSTMSAHSFSLPVI